MNYSRRFGAIVAVATAAVGMTAVATTVPAAAASRGPEPVSSRLRGITAYTNSAVTVYWRTDRRVCDFEARIAGRNIAVDYPGHRNSTSLHRGDTLMPGRIDFTVFLANARFNRPGVARLRAVISYDNCSRRARTEHKSFTLTLPVLPIHNRPTQGGGSHGTGNQGGNGHNGGSQGGNSHGSGHQDGNSHDGGHQGGNSHDGGDGHHGNR